MQRPGSWIEMNKDYRYTRRINSKPRMLIENIKVKLYDDLYDDRTFIITGFTEFQCDHQNNDKEWIVFHLEGLPQHEARMYLGQYRCKDQTPKELRKTIEILER